MILDTLNDAQLGVSVQGTTGEGETDPEDETRQYWEYGRTGGSVLFFLAAMVADCVSPTPRPAPKPGAFEYSFGVTAVLALLSVAIGFGPKCGKAASAAWYGVVDVTSLMIIAVAGALLGGKWVEAAA